MNLGEKAVAWALDYAYAIRYLVPAAFDRHDPGAYRDGDGHKPPVLVLPGVYETWQFLRPLIERLHGRGHPVHVVTALHRNAAPVAASADLVAAYPARAGGGVGGSSPAEAHCADACDDGGPMTPLPMLRRITGRGGRFEVSRLHRSGPDPRRVLMVGDRSVLGQVDGPVERRLPEQVADLLAGTSGRGLDLDVLTDLSPALAAVRGTFNRWRLWRYDAVLLVVDTAAVGTRADRHLAALLDEVASDASVHAGVVVNLVRRARSGHGRHHPGRELDPWERPETIDPDVVWLLVRVSPGPNEPLPAADVLRVAGDLAATVDAARPVGRRADRPEDDELERQRALGESGALERPQETELDHIVALAQEAFGVQSAELNFLDADHSWHVAVAGAARGNHPRTTSYCNATIQQPGPTVIGDARHDPRMRHLAHIPGVPAFYAAYPIESIDGYRIGTLCVYDPRPRDADEVDVALLRDLALLAEAEIIDPSGPRTSALRTVAPVG